MRPLGAPGAPLGLWAPRKILGCHPLSTALTPIITMDSIYDETCNAQSYVNSIVIMWVARMM